MLLLDERYLDKPTHGVLQMQDYLREKGYCINIKRIRCLLRLMGIMTIVPKRNLSSLGEKCYLHPYLLRNLKVNRPNQVWAIDITYVPMEKGFLYLTAVIDVYSRFVVGWGLSNSLHSKTYHSVLKEAIKLHGKPDIVNSDQGSQFTCKDWVDYLKAEQIQISMDGRGWALDNIYIERLWRTVKQDYVYLLRLKMDRNYTRELEFFLVFIIITNVIKGLGDKSHFSSIKEMLRSVFHFE